MDLARWFSDGGPAMYVVLGLGLTAPIVSVVMVWAIGFMKWRVPATLSWLGLSATLFAGYAGAWWGTQQAAAAIAVASPEMRAVLGAMGGALALHPATLAERMVGASFVLVALAAALPAAISVGPGAKIDTRSLLGASGGAVLGGLIAVAIALLSVGMSNLMGLGPSLLVLPVGSAAATLAVVIASARVAKEDRMHQGRIAGSRGFVLITGTLGVLLLGEAFRHSGVSMAAQAVAHAAPETKGLIMAQGQMIAAGSSRLAWAFAVPPFLAGCLGLFPIFGRAEGRVAIGAALGAAQLAVVFGMWLVVTNAVRALMDASMVGIEVVLPPL